MTKGSRDVRLSEECWLEKLRNKLAAGDALPPLTKYIVDPIWRPGGIYAGYDLSEAADGFLCKASDVEARERLRDQRETELQSLAAHWKEKASTMKLRDELEAAEAREAVLRQQVDPLRQFAQAILDEWPEGGVEMDGAELQELATLCGLLRPEQRTERCGENCQCADESSLPCACYRRTELLTGAAGAASG